MLNKICQITGLMGPINSISYPFILFLSLYCLLRPCRGRGGGGSSSPVGILKRLVSVFINACRLLSALLSLSQFGRGRLSLVTISFYALSLLFGP